MQNKQGEWSRPPPSQNEPSHWFPVQRASWGWHWWGSFSRESNRMYWKFNSKSKTWPNASLRSSWWNMQKKQHWVGSDWQGPIRTMSPARSVCPSFNNKTQAGCREDVQESENTTHTHMHTLHTDPAQETSLPMLPLLLSLPFTHIFSPLLYSCPRALEESLHSPFLQALKAQILPPARGNKKEERPSRIPSSPHFFLPI